MPEFIDPYNDVVQGERSAPLKLAGYRHIDTGIIRSARFVQHDQIHGPEEYEPIFTGGPEVFAPLLSALIALADDHSEGATQRAGRFLEHRWAAQRALSEFVDMGGRIP